MGNMTPSTNRKALSAVATNKVSHANTILMSSDGKLHQHVLFNWRTGSLPPTLGANAESITDHIANTQVRAAQFSEKFHDFYQILVLQSLLFCKFL
jgi:hypothetical protein